MLVPSSSAFDAKLAPALIFLGRVLIFFYAGSAVGFKCDTVARLRTRKVLLIFENYSIDRLRRELRRGPSLQRVEPQVFDLLLFLIDTANVW